MKLFKTISLIGLYLAALGTAAEAFTAYLKEHSPQPPAQPKAKDETQTEQN